MIAKSMPSDGKLFSTAKGQSDLVAIPFCTSIDNKLSKEPIEMLEVRIERLKGQYKFIHPDEISTYLRSYPFLIVDLDEIYEIKSQYFGEAPMTLYYIDDTGLVEHATLAVYIQLDMPREEAREIFSQFDDDWWEKVSEEAQLRITVDRECTHV
jgi:hypothetical protein